MILDFFKNNEPQTGNNPKWCYNNQFTDCVLNCHGISFRLFQEDIADDDWLAETQINISDIVKKEQSFWLKLDPKGELHVKIDLNRPMGLGLKLFSGLFYLPQKHFRSKWLIIFIAVGKFVVRKIFLI